MARHPYLKEWRKYRHLTQEQVVDRLAALDDPMIPQTAASLSRLENGKQPYTQRSLEALADIYQCAPGDLLERNPEKAGEVVDLLSSWPMPDRDRAFAVLKAMRDAS